MRRRGSRRRDAASDGPDDWEQLEAHLTKSRRGRKAAPALAVPPLSVKRKLAGVSNVTDFLDKLQTFIK